ncbi:hypothetical protein [Bordetella trematum]|uniref:hypothetical protein n=1 Tax=Bordetella trematum TaxID=123899 RepID=UPI000D97CFFE|nr:hypothetical protein [Bordetella trematum]SPU49878.1 Uncharacterised protein [Bordetella trematum]VDH07622.1 Uncharacterised protein [Bordetella trematum]
MKQQIISLLERAKENGTTIGDVLAEVRGMRQDCTQHAESKLEWINTPDIRDVPDCVLTPSGIALKQSQTSAPDERTQVDDDLVSSLLRMAEVAPASECEILQAAAAALASAPVADERDRNDTISQIVGLCNRIPGATTWNAAQFMYDEMHRRAALANAPAAGEAQPVGRVRHFNYSGIARNDFSQEAVLNEDAPSLPDGTLLYAAPQASPAADERDAKDAARWRLVRRKLCLTGNGDGTCAMHALNLPASIPGWPEPGDAVAEFCDAAIDAAIAAQQGEGGGV